MSIQPEPMIDPNAPGGAHGYGTVQMWPSKRYVPVRAFRPEHVCIQDIAWHLAMQRRYAGGSAVPIPVAWHCLNVMERLPAFLKSQGLFHDAAEAYINDVVRPLKYDPAFEGYLEIERGIEVVLFPTLGLPQTLAKAVKEADNEVLAWEIANVRHNPSFDLPPWVRDERRLARAFEAAAWVELNDSIGFDRTKELWLDV